MTKQTKVRFDTEKTANAARSFTRRTILRRAAAGAALAAGPFVIRRGVLASSGEIDILMWSDYLPPDFIAEFESSSGIKINYTGIGSNEEIISRMKAAKGRGWQHRDPAMSVLSAVRSDVIFIDRPTRMRSFEYPDTVPQVGVGHVGAQALVEGVILVFRDRLKVGDILSGQFHREISQTGFI